MSLPSDGLPLRAAALLIGGAAVVGVVSGGMVGMAMGAAGLVALGAAAARGRDPSRTPPPGATNLLLAPVDGRIAAVEEGNEGRYVDGPATRLSIARPLLASRVQRIPADGVVEFVGPDGPALGLRHVSGHRVLLTPAGQGPVLAIGAEVTGGARLGVDGGARVDLAVARGVAVSACVGDVVRAGETVIGHFPLTPAGTSGTAAGLAGPPLVAGASTSGTSGA